MAKLTMNTPGRDAPSEAEFAPPRRGTPPKWVLAGGTALFLVMFAGLVITTTLLVSQSNKAKATVVETARTVEEPSYSDFGNTVTRQDVSLLQTDTTVQAPGLAPTVQTALPNGAADAPSAPSIEVPTETLSTLRLGAAHRYRVPNCVDYLDTLVKITIVNFPLGSDEPAAADMIRARNIATAVASCDEVKVIVEGHSDRRGDEQVNMDLSWLRAQSVINQLQREGFDISAMQPRGFGAKWPINLSGTTSGEAVNRRVQFTLAPRGVSSAARVSGN